MAKKQEKKPKGKRGRPRRDPVLPLSLNVAVPLREALAAAAEAEETSQTAVLEDALRRRLRRYL